MLVLGIIGVLCAVAIGISEASENEKRWAISKRADAAFTHTNKISESSALLFSSNRSKSNDESRVDVEKPDINSRARGPSLRGGGRE